MATTFFLRNSDIGIATYGTGATGNLSTVIRGTTAVATYSATSVSSGTWVSLGYFATQPLINFSFSGAITCNLRGDEANNNANASLGVRFYRWNKTVGLSASLGQASATVELATSETAVTANLTPTAAAFADGDSLVFEIGIINIGTMGARVVNFYFNGAAGATGDSFITINPNVSFQRRLIFTE